MSIRDQENAAINTELARLLELPGDLVKEQLHINALGKMRDSDSYVVIIMLGFTPKMLAGTFDTATFADIARYIKRPNISFPNTTTL